MFFSLGPGSRSYLDKWSLPITPHEVQCGRRVKQSSQYANHSILLWVALPWGNMCRRQRRGLHCRLLQMFSAQRWPCCWWRMERQRSQSEASPRSWQMLHHCVSQMSTLWEDSGLRSEMILPRSRPGRGYGTGLAGTGGVM